MANRPTLAQKTRLVESRDRNYFVAQLDNTKVSEKGLWFASGNDYVPGHHDAIEKDIEEKKLNHDALAEYLSSAAFIHCQNAWSYFGGSINALLHGNASTVIHLAYYAELHAAMSILASEGIYLGNSYVCTIDGSCTLKKYSTRTHPGTWDYLSILFKDTEFRDRISQIIEPWGITWSEHNSQIKSSIDPFIVEALDYLTLDLASFTKDRFLRNLMSYNPMRLDLANVEIDSIWVADLLKQTMDWLEPTKTSTFEVIDNHLLMVALMLVCKSKRQIPNWEDWLIKEFKGHTKEETIVQQVTNYGTARIEELRNKLAFQDGYPKATITQTIEALFTRAVFLLRLSTGCAKTIHKDCIDLELENWIKGIIKKCNIDASIEDKQLLWVDMKDAAKELSERASQSKCFLGAEKAAYVVEEPERVLVWSFA